MRLPPRGMEWGRLARSFLGTLDERLFPRVCGFCGETFRDGLSNVLCRSCFESAPAYGGTVCSHCGVGLPPGAFTGVAEPRCAECGDASYALDACLAYGPYEGPLRLAHHAFKFEGMEHLGADLAALLAGGIRRFPDAEALVPIPSHPARVRERGYHPALILARRASLATGLPVVEALTKIRTTPAQVSLDRATRLKNLRGAFACRGRAVLRNVLLVDDVATTGGTLEECAAVLKRRGVIWVGAVVVGRTPKYAKTGTGSLAVV